MEAIQQQSSPPRWSPSLSSYNLSVRLLCLFAPQSFGPKTQKDLFGVSWVYPFCWLSNRVQCQLWAHPSYFFSLLAARNNFNRWRVKGFPWLGESLTAEGTAAGLYLCGGEIWKEGWQIDPFGSYCCLNTSLSFKCFTPPGTENGVFISLS